jgi:hypothetical protein
MAEIPWVNKCGGKRWRHLPSGLIEVEGEGTPAYPPGSDHFPHVQNTWNNWSPYFQEAAKEYALPVSWLVGIGATETGYVANNPQTQATIVSPASAQGVMQLMPSTAHSLGLDPAQRTDPRLNIMYGAKLLRMDAERYGWQLPYMAAAYNAGHVECRTGYNEWNIFSEGNYPRRTIQFNNSAMLYLKLSSGLSASVIAGGGFAIAGLATAAYMLWPARGFRR